MHIRAPVLVIVDNVSNLTKKLSKHWLSLGYNKVHNVTVLLPLCSTTLKFLKLAVNWTDLKSQHCNNSSFQRTEPTTSEGNSTLDMIVWAEVDPGL